MAGLVCVPVSGRSALGRFAGLPPSARARGTPGSGGAAVARGADGCVTSGCNAARVTSLRVSDPV